MELEWTQIPTANNGGGEIEHLQDGDRGNVGIHIERMAAKKWVCREQALCAAVLEQAIRDWLWYKEGDHAKEELREWISNGSDFEYSFVMLCHVLNLNPNAVRQRFFTNQVERVYLAS